MGMMKSFWIEEPFKTQIKEVEIPVPGPGEVLLKIMRAGLCGSDLNTYRGANPLVRYPVLPGHEISGIVEKKGTDTPDGIIPGRKAAVIPYTSCGRCSSCRKHRFNACSSNQTLGVQRKGCMAEYIVVKHNKLIMNQSLSYDELALVEPLTVGFHAVSRANVKKNEIVAVLGTGTIGLGVVSGASFRNAKVIGIDIDDRKLEVARLAGADYIVNSAKDNLHCKLFEFTKGDGPDVMVEAVGVPQTFLTAVEEVCSSGRVVYIGYTKQKVEYETKIFVHKELDIFGSRNATLKDFQGVISMLEAKKFPVRRVIDHIIPMDRLDESLKLWYENPSDYNKIIVSFEGVDR